MESLDEVLTAFEEALELERELGTRTVECDRALLMPTCPAAAQRPAPVAAAAAAVAQRPAAKPAPSIPRPPPSVAPQSAKPDSRSSVPDFVFIVAQLPQGAAAELLGRMVAAMGYAMGQVRVVEAEEALKSRPPARVYVVLGGSDAFRIFAPGQRAALGLWTQVHDVPTIVTYSPARILSYFGGDAAGLAKAKRQIWSDLKSALARIGKTPPARQTMGR
ncbi:MAG: hypothetical protein ACI4RA_00115 [Kiritimatiellia bacterium]